MAAQAFPIRMDGSNFQFGKVDIPLDKATCFWVGDKKHHRIHVYLRNGDYQTTLRLFLETQENMHKCIELLLNNPKLKPSLFDISSIKPQLRDDAPAVVEFGFILEADAEYAATYIPPLLDPDIRLEREEKKVTLSYEKAEARDVQIKRINEVFQKIKSRFVASGVNESLERLKWPFFPWEAKPAQHEEMRLDQIKEFNITSRGVIQEIDFRDNVQIEIPVDPTEFLTWVQPYSSSSQPLQDSGVVAT
jgi:hypothetical protein